MGKEHVLRVASELHDMMSLDMEYAVAKVGQATELEGWVKRKTATFDPSSNSLNCFEIILYSALTAGVLTPSDIANVYLAVSEAVKKAGMRVKPQAYATTFIRSVTCGKMQHYDLCNHIPTPAPGDLVFFGVAGFKSGIMHAAVATGDLIQGAMVSTRGGANVLYEGGVATVGTMVGPHSLESMVFSFWPRYGITVARGKFQKTAPPSLERTRVEITTIEDLVLGMAIEMGDCDEIDISKYYVAFATPVWSGF